MTDAERIADLSTRIEKLEADKAEGRTWRTGQQGKQTSRIGRVGTCEGSSGGHAREIEKRDPLPRQRAQQGRHS